MSQIVVALVLALLACQPVLADASCVSGALGQGAHRVCNMAMAMAPTSSMGADCAMGSTSAARFCAPNCCQSSLYQSVGLLTAVTDSSATGTAQSLAAPPMVRTPDAAIVSSRGSALTQSGRARSILLHVFRI